MSNRRGRLGASCPGWLPILPHAGRFSFPFCLELLCLRKHSQNQATRPLSLEVPSLPPPSEGLSLLSFARSPYSHVRDQQDGNVYPSCPHALVVVLEWACHGGCGVVLSTASDEEAQFRDKHNPKLSHTAYPMTVSLFSVPSSLWSVCGLELEEREVRGSTVSETALQLSEP